MNKEYRIKFAKRIKELRIKNNLSIKKLSQLIGISTSTLTNYEKAKNLPKINNLKKLAIFYQVKVNYLLCIE